MKRFKRFLCCAICIGCTLLFTSCAWFYPYGPASIQVNTPSQSSSSTAVTVPTASTQSTQLTAKWVRSDGSVISRYNVTWHATLGENSLEVDLPLPDFPYTFPGGISLTPLLGPYAELPYFIGFSPNCFSTTYEANVSYHLAYDSQKEYLLIAWKDSAPDHYLVCAQDPTVSPQQILDHFSEFITML